MEKIIRLSFPILTLVTFALLSFALAKDAYPSFKRKQIITSNSISSSKYNTLDTATPDKTADTVCSLINRGEFRLIYTISAKEITDLFSEDEFSSGLENSSIEKCQKTGEAVYLSNSWAKCSINISYTDKTSKEFTLITKKEDNSWLFYGTDEN